LPHPTPVTYVAEISGVREVTLRAHADLAYWRSLLAPLDLHPTAADGRAHLHVSAAASTYKGLPFREFSISVLTSDDPAGDSHDGFYLAHAFNSSRFFAFVERTCFATPYHHGRIDVDPAAAHARVTRGHQTLVAAEMSPRAAPAPPAELSWQGPVFLPPRRAGEPSTRFFRAKLSGPALTCPFDPNSDRVTLNPSPDAPILRHLLDSDFTPFEWLLRHDGRHGKSKTVRRTGQSAHSPSSPPPAPAPR
jgi:hypothetical protein